MKKKIFIGLALILPIIIAAVLHYLYAFEYRFKKLMTQLDPEIQECQKQQKELFIGSLIKGKSNFDKPRFVSKQDEAIKILDSIDLTKITLSIDKKLNEFLLNNCNTRNIKQFLLLGSKRDVCHSIFDEYAFYKALVTGMKKNRWSKKTKLQAKTSILNFVKYQTEQKASVTNLNVAMSLLKLLIEENLIPNKHRELIKNTFIDAQQKSLRLRVTFRELLTPKEKLSCENYKKYKIIEEETIDTTVKQMLAMLNVIEN